MEQQAATERARREAAEARAAAGEGEEEDTTEREDLVEGDAFGASEVRDEAPGNDAAVRGDGDHSSGAINYEGPIRYHLKTRLPGSYAFDGPSDGEPGFAPNYGTSYNNSNAKRTRFAPEPALQQQQPSPFPALYRVVKDEGAIVWNADCATPLRTIPFGVVVLCQSLQWTTGKGFMMRVPDGWLTEDSVVRVRTLVSLQESAAARERQSTGIAISS
jgi:hypothetical protein